MRLSLAEPVTLEATRAQTLDELWHEAEQLGRVEADHAVFEKEYRVRIMFTRRSGTTVWAEGKDRNIAFALAKAINEARDMGAGVQT